MKNLIIFLVLHFSTTALCSIKVAITIDDLPSHAQMPSGVSRLEIVKKMITTMGEFKLPPVYGFVNASKVDKDPTLGEALKVWMDSGNLLGNHTYSHKSLNKSTVTEFENEIELNEVLLRKYSPKNNWHYFRYPFLHEGNSLDKKNQIRTYLAKKNYKVAEVTIDFDDWIWNNSYARCADKKDVKNIEWLRKSYIEGSLASLKRAVEISDKIFKRPIPHILLLHIGAFDAEMLKPLIEAYQKDGVEFVSLDLAAQDDVYSLNPQVVFDSGVELIYQIMKERGISSNDLNLKNHLETPTAKLEEVCR